MEQPMTITLDPQRQQQMNNYCALAGISQEKAMDEVWSLWEQFVYIPRTNFMEKEERQRKACEAFRRQRERVENGETREWTMEEIIEEIKQARAERRAREEQA